MIEVLIPSLLIIPFIAFIICMFIDKYNESIISKLAIGTASIQFLIVLMIIFVWAISGFHQTNLTEITLYKSSDYHFFIDLLLDKSSISFLFIGSFLSLMVALFSQYYLHKEEGYKRFFTTILIFYFGYNMTVLSGNFETLFVGWEVLGISSFLLIAFYRYRYLPVKNAVKIFTIYRMGDVGILLAMWLSHHFWHENVTFVKMEDVSLISEHIHQHSILGLTIGLSILLAAAAKSAQFPFSFWLPRAMEGPTPSSAIFYGSLSVHMGVFLLIRVFPMIEHQVVLRVIIGLLGLTTFLISTGISRVQSSIKSQVAYASIAHIGLMFIEISFGLQTIAILHFMGNAMLRTYQLLISPSVVSYKIREQFYSFDPMKKSVENFFPKKIEYALYILSLKEFNLDHWAYFYTWLPVKWVGKKLNFMTLKGTIYFLIALIVAAIISFELDIKLHVHLLSNLLGIVGLLLSLKSFSEKNNSTLAYSLIIINHVFVALAVFFNETLSSSEILIYMSGVVIMGMIGLLALRNMVKMKEIISLDRFHGHAFEHPKTGIVFLIGCLGLTGFPISPTFIGEDLMFSHIHENQILLAFLVACIFVINGLALIRIYAKLFLGPHSKTYHEIAYRNS